MRNNSNEQPVIYFDGVCNLCNGAVQFIIKHDKKKIFRFASLQSEAGRSALVQYTQGATSAPDSIILQENNKYHIRSGAALRIARHLNGLWPLLYGLIIVPRSLRDSVYNFISRNRYKWFGKRNECMMPAPELKERFL